MVHLGWRRFLCGANAFAQYPNLNIFVIIEKSFSYAVCKANNLKAQWLGCHDFIK